MSALALPSFIAPAPASAPQGSTGTDNATGFMSLLATCLDNDAEGGKTDDPMIVAPANDGGEPAPATALPPAPVPVLVIAPVASTPAPEDQAAASGEILPVASAAPEPDLSSLLQNSGAPPAPPVTPGAAAPSEPARQAPPPPVASAAPDSDAAAEVDAPAATADAKAANAAANAPSTATSTSTAAAAAMTAAVGVAPARAVLEPTPPPLRALAERTSRPLDAPVDRTAAPSVSGADAGEAKDGAALGPVARSGPERTAGPADTAPKPATDVVAGSDDPSIDAAAAGESAAASNTSTGQTRETSLSGLSRATIDATAQIAAQILRKLEGRSTRFEMALTPDDLGRVDVRLDIDSEGRLAARLAFDNPAAATDLRGRVDDLRRQLEDAGFHLADDALEFTERDSGSSGFDRGQDARDGQNRAFTAASRLNAEIDVAQPPRWMALSLSPAGVDLKV